jgi:hypothetical protein
VHIRIIFFAIAVRTGMNNTNNHSNVCVIIIWKSYDAIDYVTWVLRVLNSTRRGSQNAWVLPEHPFYPSYPGFSRASPNQGPIFLTGLPIFSQPHFTDFKPIVYATRRMGFTPTCIINMRWGGGMIS